MIYLDWGATSFQKPSSVSRAMLQAMERCANPGRGGYPAAMEAANVLYRCRETAGQLFHCNPEQVVLTGNCTHGLNMAIRTLVSPGDSVVVSGFEHNAVMRPLYALGAQIHIAGRRLFDPQDTLVQWEAALKKKPKAAICTHVSNVFGYVLPVWELARLCKIYDVPLIMDAAQSAGGITINFSELGATFVAMPGHKGLLGPQGTGLLLCAREVKPLLLGGTGGDSLSHTMPEQLPEQGEAGTANVPGIAGLTAGMKYLLNRNVDAIGKKEASLARYCAETLEHMGIQAISGFDQAGVVSILPRADCEDAAMAFSKKGFALRGGLHCAPLAHESVGTVQTGTLRLSTGPFTTEKHCQAFLHAAGSLQKEGVL